MVDLSVAEGKLALHVRGADKLWAFKSSSEIPLIHITGVRADPEDWRERSWDATLLIPSSLILVVLSCRKVFVSPIFATGSFLVGIGFGSPAGFFEEIGWTGYAFSKMCRNTSAGASIEERAVTARDSSSRREIT